MSKSLVRIGCWSALMMIALSSAACAPRLSMPELRTVTATVADFKATVPAKAAEPCDGAELPPKDANEQDYQVFGRLQTGKLEVCDYKRALGVAAILLHNDWVDYLVKTQKQPGLFDRVINRKPEPPPKPDIDELNDRLSDPEH